ncbi:MAG: type VI secretion system Vgr family protein [Sandaracinaceae bacterium]
MSYAFESAAMGERLHVHSMHLTEALNQPYLAEVLVTTPEPDSDMALMLGQDATLTITRASEVRTVRGLVVALTELDTGGRKVLNEARVTLAPAMYLLSLRRNTRMFQEMAVDEILTTVLEEALGAYGRSIELSLNEAYEPREYCLQYAETDLAFVQRLMEEEGIAYSFDHVGDIEVLRLTDANQAFPAAPTVNGALPYVPDDATAGDASDCIFRFRMEGRHTTTAVTLNDWDWTLATMPFTEAVEGEDELGRVRESYEHGEGRTSRIGSYDEGARRYQAHDMARLAGVRHEEAIRDVALGHGIGTAIGISAGTTIQLTGHPTPGADGEYLVMRVEHFDAGVEGSDGRDNYHNRFVCTPIETVFRPRRVTPKPSIPGSQTAVVTGAAGEEIHVDEHGRIKVRFHWDRENPEDDTSSCWVRVKQEWAGPNWGSWWVPRMGMEVTVHFVDGDPDRPLVTGALYNGNNPTPYSLPDEKTKSTIKSDSSLGHTGFAGTGFNEFRFEDKAGSEQVFTHAEKDYNEVVENDHNTLVHHDQSNEVDNDQTQIIHNNQMERVDVDQQMSVGGNRTVHVEGDYDETVDGTETRQTTGDVEETFDATETRSIAASITEDIAGNETRDISADQTETIGAAHSLTVLGNQDLTVTGALNQDVSAGITTVTPAGVDVIVGGNWSLSADGGVTIIAPAGIKIIAPGGVQRIDKSWQLTATGMADYAAVVDFEMFVTKVGLNLSFEASVAIMRYNDKLSENLIKGAATAVKGAWMKKYGVKSDSGGIDVEHAQEVKTGGA